MQTPGRTDVGAIAVTVLLLIIAAGALWQAREFSSMGAIFPRTIGAVLLVACAITLWRTLRRRAPMSRGLPREGWVRGVLLIAVTSLWIVLLERVGFVAAGIAAYLALALITNRDPVTVKRLLWIALVSVVFVVAFQLVFVYGLKVQLPTGTLFKQAT